MSTPINIISTDPIKDAEGFVTKGDNIIASVKAYKEVRNTTAKWERIIGNAAFSSVTAMFRFRKIPGLTVTTSYFISEADGRYNIINAEDIRRRVIYIKMLKEKLDVTLKKKKKSK